MILQCAVYIEVHVLHLDIGINGLKHKMSVKERRDAHDSILHDVDEAFGAEEISQALAILEWIIRRQLKWHQLPSDGKVKLKIVGILLYFKRIML